MKRQPCGEAPYKDVGANPRCAARRGPLQGRARLLEATKGLRCGLGAQARQSLGFFQFDFGRGLGIKIRQLFFPAHARGSVLPDGKVEPIRG